MILTTCARLREPVTADGGHIYARSNPFRAKDGDPDQPNNWRPHSKRTRFTIVEALVKSGAIVTAVWQRRPLPTRDA